MSSSAVWLPRRQQRRGTWHRPRKTKGREMGGCSPTSCCPPSLLPRCGRDVSWSFVVVVPRPSALHNVADGDVARFSWALVDFRQRWSSTVVGAGRRLPIVCPSLFPLAVVSLLLGVVGPSPVVVLCRLSSLRVAVVAVCGQPGSFVVACARWKS